MAQRSPDVEPARAAGGFSSSQVFAIPTPCGPPVRAEPCGGTAGGHPQASLGRILLRGPGSSCQGSGGKGRSSPGGGLRTVPKPRRPPESPADGGGPGPSPPGSSGPVPLRRLSRRLSTAHAPERSTPSAAPQRCACAQAHPGRLNNTHAPEHHSPRPATAHAHRPPPRRAAPGSFFLPMMPRAGRVSRERRFSRPRRGRHLGGAGIT